jgi:hypothetical protein
MSDLYIRVIPTDPQWQPTAEAAARATEYVAGLFAGPGDHVEVVEPVFHERITLIDGGEYMEELFCSRCDATIGLDWFWDLLIARNGGRRVGEPVIDDLAGLESLRREVGTSHGEIAAGRGLQLVYRGGVELAFESGVGG